MVWKLQQSSRVFFLSSQEMMRSHTHICDEKEDKVDLKRRTNGLGQKGTKATNVQIHLCDCHIVQK